MKVDAAIGAVGIKLGGHEVELAQSAATWLERFYPGVIATLDGSQVRISKARASREQLIDLWRVAFLNEQMFHANRTQRRHVLERLFQ